MLVREATGSLAALNATSPVFNVDDCDRYSVQLTGTWVGNVQIECSVDGTTWVIGTFHASTATSAATLVGNTGFTANGLWGTSYAIPTYKFVRVRFAAYTSGTVVYSLASFRMAK